MASESGSAATSCPQAESWTALSMLSFSSSATGADWWDMPTTSTLMHNTPQPFD